MVLLLALLLLCLSVGLGNLFGGWYAARTNKNESFVAVLFWVNLAAWCIPWLGLFVAESSRRINAQNYGTDKRRFAAIINFGMSLSVLGVAFVTIAVIFAPIF